jgi:DNA-binding XRE family transcriptional regulator
MGTKFTSLSGDRVRAMRQRLFLTQAELGEKAGLHESTIRSIEADEGTPSRRSAGHHPSTIRNLAEALKCKPTDICEDVEVPA